MESPAEYICCIEVDDTLCKLAGVSSEVMCSTYMRASSLYACGSVCITDSLSCLLAKLWR